tara:strand:+ start:278 stop:595 length:318 start_codon:yes stop_codon:yes gene_type:complete
VIRALSLLIKPMQLMQGPLIRTKYLGPTNYRGSRITATHKRDGEQTQRVTLSWNHSLDGLENAKAAALALCAKWPYEQTMTLVACGFDHDHYYFIASPEPISSPA